VRLACESDIQLESQPRRMFTVAVGSTVRRRKPSDGRGVDPSLVDTHTHAFLRVT